MTSRAISHPVLGTSLIFTLFLSCCNELKPRRVPPRSTEATDDPSGGEAKGLLTGGAALVLAITDMVFSSTGVYFFNPDTGELKDSGMSGSGDSLFFYQSPSSVFFVDRQIPAVRSLKLDPANSQNLVSDSDRRLKEGLAGDPHDILKLESGEQFTALNLAKMVTVTQQENSGLKKFQPLELSLAAPLSLNLHPEKLFYYQGHVYVLMQGFDSVYTPKQGGLARLRKSTQGEWDWDQSFFVTLNSSFPDQISEKGGALYVGGLCYHQLKGCIGNLEKIDVDSQNSTLLLDFADAGLSLGSTGFIEQKTKDQLAWLGMVMRNPVSQSVALTRLIFYEDKVAIDYLWEPSVKLQFALIYLNPFNNDKVFVSSFLTDTPHESHFYELDINDPKPDLEPKYKGLGLVTGLQTLLQE